MIGQPYSGKLNVRLDEGREDAVRSRPCRLLPTLHFVISFEHKEDAQRVMDALGPLLGHFGLTLHPDKTRRVPFRRPPKGQEGGKGRATFDFLGFTFYRARTRKGRWGMFCKTRSASLRRTIQSVYR
jgi:hypothetical protein